MRKLLQLVCIGLFGTLLGPCVYAQQAPAEARSVMSSPYPAISSSVVAEQQKGVPLDRIVAIVNGDILLESDVQEEMRYDTLLPYHERSQETPYEQALDRLIDRTLIVQQQRGYVPIEVTEDQIDAEEKEMREGLPACMRFHCNTEAGWENFLKTEGFTEKDVRARLKTRVEVMHFIEQRFRAGIRISDEEIQDFYNKNMLPQYAAQHVQPPPLTSVQERIQQVLLQQQVTELMSQWLKSLHEQGSVRILKPGEEAP